MKPGTAIWEWIQEENQAGRHPNVLFLTLKKFWFDMILDGGKREEYRDPDNAKMASLLSQPHTHVHFRNGYGYWPQNPEALFPIGGDGRAIRKLGNPLWGAPAGKERLALPLGPEIWRRT
jgi:hypothetical protein